MGTTRSNHDTRKPEGGQASIQYVLAELNHVQEARRNMTSHILQRVNLHLAIVSGSVILITYFNSTLLQTAAYLLTSLLLAAILILGLLIYAEMVQGVMAHITLDRYAAKLKRYFEDEDPQLMKYVGGAFDDQPILVRRHSLRDILKTNLGSKQIVTFLNNVIGGAMAACVVLSISPATYTLTSVVGVGSFFIIWILQYLYGRLRYRLEEEDTRVTIRFPQGS